MKCSNIIRSNKPLAVTLTCFLLFAQSRVAIARMGANSLGIGHGLVLRLLAGNVGGFGSIDGVGTASRFYYPSQLAMDAAGTIYVADKYNCTIRKITSNGVVTTLAGSPASYGSADGTGAAARFSSPEGIAVDSSGNVYVADTGNCTIRKITPAGVVTTLAGSAGSCAETDGTGAAARFLTSYGLTIDGSGNIFVADTSGQTIRKITPAGVVTTFAGTANTQGSVDGTGLAAQFYNPAEITIDGAGNLYVDDVTTCVIRKITPGAVVTTLAGTANTCGNADGTGAAASFTYPWGIGADSSGNVYVPSNNAIRKITPGGVVTTLAGTAGTSGSSDGTGAVARFNIPIGIVADSSGNIFVADKHNNIIRKITSGGVVTTFAGAVALAGSADGTGSAATFGSMNGAAVDGSGNVYVADTSNQKIRKITSGGAVTTFAGSGSIGSADGTGTGASFHNPISVAVDGSGNVYVSDESNYTIRKITPGGVVTTLAGSAGVSGSADGTGAAATFNNPYGLAVDGSGNVYVADASNNTIRMITPGGVVTTLAGLAGTSGSSDGTGAAARFNFPTGVALDGSGNVYVSDYLNSTIRKITAGGVVTTLAGTAGATGNSDGTGAAARFKSPVSIAVFGSGNIYVADNGNFAIRKVTLAGVVTTVSAAHAAFSGNAGFSVPAVLPAPLDPPLGITTDGKNLYILEDNAVVYCPNP